MTFNQLINLNILHMKKLILILVAFMAISTTAQTKPSYPTVKLTKLATGLDTDDVLVIGADKQVKKVAKSSIQTDISGKENTIAPGTTSQYFRGDKTWQEFPTVDLSGYVKTTENQIISGSKEFTQDIFVNSIQLGKGSGNGISNLVLGRNTFMSNISGLSNVAIGTYTLYSNSSGKYNMAIGANSLLKNTTGNNNVGIGYESLRMSETGGSNVGIGTNSLLSSLTGSNNVGIGFNAGASIFNGPNQLSVVNNSIFIGSETKALGNSQTNQIVIGHEAIGAGSNSVTLGNNAITKTVLRGKINAAGMPVYADNAAAIAGGLEVGDEYRTSTGDLKIVY